MASSETKSKEKKKKYSHNKRHSYECVWVNFFPEPCAAAAAATHAAHASKTLKTQEFAE